MNDTAIPEPRDEDVFATQLDEDIHRVNKTIAARAARGEKEYSAVVDDDDLQALRTAYPDETISALVRLAVKQYAKTEHVV